MAVSNSLSTRPKFSVAIQSEGYKNLINNTLSDPRRAAKFIASITSAVAVNPALQECDPSTILSAGLLGEALNLSPSPQLGMYFMVPYDDKKRGCKVVQFQIGYKGLLQLAIRSGYYKKINVLPIKEGELIRFEPLSEEIDVKLIEDDVVRDNTPTMGYYCFFEYLNGFRKALYWSYEKMISHADQYSKAFSRETYEKIQRGEIPKSDMWKYSSFYYKDFDLMACKTMLRQLLSKWGIMSTELENALFYDQGVGVIKDGKLNGVDYVDAVDAVDEVPIIASAEPVSKSADPLA